MIEKDHIHVNELLCAMHFLSTYQAVSLGLNSNIDIYILLLDHQVDIDSGKWHCISALLTSETEIITDQLSAKREASEYL